MELVMVRDQSDRMEGRERHDAESIAVETFFVRFVSVGMRK